MHRRAWMIAALLAGAARADALDSFIIGPRSLAMGGTGVADAEPQAMQQINPALLATPIRVTPETEPSSWGTGLDVQAGLRVQGDLLEIARELREDRAGSGQGIQSPADVARVVRIMRNLASIGDPGNAVTADADGGVGVRIGRFAIACRVEAESSGLVLNTDLTNVALNAAGPALATQINNSGAPNDGTVALMTTAQRNRLYSAFGGTGAFDPATSAGTAVLQLDYAMRQQGVSQQDLARVADGLANAANGTGPLADNNTAVRIGGLAVAEVPVSYAYPLTPELLLGASLKLMVGRVYGTQVSVFTDDPVKRLTRGISNYNQTVTFGIDLGAVYRIEWFTIGVVGRNLNSPRFDGFVDQNGVTVSDTVAHAQAAAGVAVTPWRWLTLQLDADLTGADTTFPGYQTQRVGGGVEVRPWHRVALRAGLFKNIAQGDIPPVVTAGIGGAIGPVAIDLALAASTTRTEINGHNLPNEMRVAFGLSGAF